MENKSIKRAALLLACTLFVATPSFAHVVVGELEKMSAKEQLALYLTLGYQHILPLGTDHILFVLSLFLLSPKLKPILWQSSAFTVAHSVTLGLAMYGVLAPPSSVVEPLISLSIIFVALENIFRKGLGKTRMALVFIFGLVHGLGFASSLSQMGLPQTNRLPALVLFNLGVELGQLTVILIAFFLVGKWFGGKPFYRKVIVVPASLIIVLVAGYWTIERLIA